MTDAVTTPEPATRKDRFIAKVLQLATRLLYREIEVHWEPVPPGRPHVVVANHFAGVTDALILLAVMPTRPGIVASGVIWKTPLVGRLMDWIGAIPVHKASDGGGGSTNDAMFASCYRTLADGHDILIFPEGVTRNEPSIAEVKTGAARIALGARANGAADVVVVPVGLHYENKARLRSRVFVNGGAPIEPGAVVPDADVGLGADDRAAVDALTAEIDVSLRRAAPDYADWSEAHLLTSGAEVTLRSLLPDPAASVPIGLRDRLANALADRPGDARRQVCETTANYRRDLDDLGVSDAQLASHVTARSFLATLVGHLALGVVLAPYALVGAVVNLLPFVVVKAIGRLRVAPSMQATIKPLGAVAATSVAWGAVIWWASSVWGWQAGLVAAVLMPVYAAATVLFIERAAAFASLLARRRHRRAADRLREQLTEERDRVVGAVIAA